MKKKKVNGRQMDFFEDGIMTWREAIEKLRTALRARGWAAADVEVLVLAFRHVDALRTTPAVPDRKETPVPAPTIQESEMPTAKLYVVQVD